MPILKQAVSGGVAFAGVRGEASQQVSWVREYLDGPLHSMPILMPTV
jgi:hypothetical protein